MLRRVLACLLVVLLFYPTVMQRGFASLAYPKISARLDIEPLDITLEAVSDVRDVRFLKIRSRDSLASILRRWDLPPQSIEVLTKGSSELVPARYLKPGQTIKGTFNPEGGALLSLEVPLEEERTLILRSQADGAFETRIEEVPLERRHNTYRAIVNSDVAGDLAASGVPESLVPELLDVFACVVDLREGLGAGDSIQVVAEDLYHRGNFVRTGSILAATISAEGETFKAFQFEARYYDQNGKGLCGALRRSPLDHYRVGSGFRNRRVNPVTGRIRYHKGVDLASPMGAPIRAVGDGEVVFAGRSGAYGRMVKIEHNAVFASLYAHLSRFAPDLEAGMSVRQGDIIGYVGQSGRATGPHLHYELYKNDRNVNPMTTELPSAAPIGPDRWSEFEAEVQVLAGLLAGTPQQVAALGPQR